MGRGGKARPELGPSPCESFARRRSELEWGDASSADAGGPSACGTPEASPRARPVRSTEACRVCNLHNATMPTTAATQACATARSTKERARPTFCVAVRDPASYPRCASSRASASRESRATQARADDGHGRVLAVGMAQVAIGRNAGLGHTPARGSARLPAVAARPAETRAHGPTCE